MYQYVFHLARIAGLWQIRLVCRVQAPLLVISTRPAHATRDC
jgi:hypothetical protein